MSPQNNRDVGIAGTSLWQLFRLIFVLFCLYMMGDAFYRWDGFSYYATFHEFLPAVALAFIQWSSVAALVTLLLWLSVKGISYPSSLLGLRIGFDHVLLFNCLCVLMVVAVLEGIHIAWPLLDMTLMVKLIILFTAAFLSLILSRRYHAAFSRGLHFILEQITPLVWLFGIFIVLSVPLVAYHTWFKGEDKKVLKNVISPSPSGKKRPNIILVTFDALTARDMSVYGYQRETTPFISEWAKRSSVFTNVKAASTNTTPSTASIVTGKRLWSHGAYHQQSSIRGGKSENIAHELMQNGYYTTMYTENSNASPKTLGVSESFYNITFMLEGRDFLHNYHAALFSLFHGRIRLYDWLLLDDFYPTSLLMTYVYYPIYSPISKIFFPGKKMAFSRGYTLLDKFVADIDRNPPPSPFFAWIHLYPPHAPYVPPEPYQGVFDPSPGLRNAHEHHVRMLQITGHEVNGQITRQDLKDMETLRARYNEDILYCDREFEDFIEHLEKKNMLENSVIMLSSDHGESFEHNHVGHGNSPYEPLVHIPLIIRGPEQEEGRIFNDVIEQIDISATILDYAGATKRSWVEGRSLLPLIRGERFPSTPALTMYFELSPSRGRKITKGFINVYEGDYKLIYYIEGNMPLLFNLKEDPGEMNDLFGKESETGRRLLDFIRNNLAKANEKIAAER